MEYKTKKSQIREHQEIIELTDIIRQPAPEEEEIIELTDIIQEPFIEDEIIELSDIVDQLPDEQIVNEPDNEKLKSLENHENLLSEFVKTEQFNDALNNVIKKMVSQRLDKILVEVIEKAVATEIEKLKKILYQDITDYED